DYNIQTNYSKKRNQNSISDGKFEKQWVNNVTTGTGIGIKINDLSSKVQQFENLSQSHVLEFLDDKFISDSWQTRAKAITFVEALLTESNSKNNVKNYFLDSHDNLQNLLNDKKSNIRKIAKNVWDLIGLN